MQCAVANQEIEGVVCYLPEMGRGVVTSVSVGVEVAIAAATAAVANDNDDEDAVCLLRWIADCLDGMSDPPNGTRTLASIPDDREWVGSCC